MGCSCKVHRLLSRLNRVALLCANFFWRLPPQRRSVDTIERAEKCLQCYTPQSGHTWIILRPKLRASASHSPHLNRSSLSANYFVMNQEERDEYVRKGYDKDDMNFALKAMRWHGWGSPVGIGIFILCIGGFLYLLHLAGLIG